MKPHSFPFAVFILIVCIIAFGFGGCSSTDYDHRMEKLGDFSREQDRLYNEWFDAVMQ